jgi:transketolase
VFSANGHGQAGPTSPQQCADRLVAKLTAFDWDVVDIDGHDPEAIAAAFEHVGKSERPLAIVARTVKGWGVASLLSGNWHGKPVPADDLQAAIESLSESAGGQGGNGALQGPPAAPPAATPKRVNPRTVEWPSFEDAMKAGGLSRQLEKGKLATRRAYGAALRAAGDVFPQVVALDGDVSNSTFAEIFAKAHPDRFFECKIAEQNMVSAAAGLAAAGYIPFANSFAKFLSRACDQVEMANISRANIKLVGSHAGISLAADGPSQMGLVDVAFYSAYTDVRADDRESPLCWFFRPADAVAAYHCTRLMVELQGMCFMPTHRPDVPLIYDPATKFEPRGFQVHGSGDDLAIVTAGYMVHVAKQVVAQLAKQNIRATLIDAYCLPVDAERLSEVLYRAGGRALVVEDNYGGGLGARVAEIAARNGGLRVETLCCQRIPKSTWTAEDILTYCGVGAAQIADHAKAMLTRPM